MNARAARALLGAAVLLAHALLLWGWQRVVAPLPLRESRQPAAPALTVLPITALSPRPKAEVPPRSEPLKPGTTRRDPLPPRAPAPGAISVPVTTPAEATAVAPSAAPPASAPERPALDLAMPRSTTAPPSRSARDQALDDARGNSPRATMESRVAAVVGTPAWTEEPMDATRTRMRKNGACIEVHVSRNAQIDPWNQNHAPTPKAVKPEC